MVSEENTGTWEEEYYMGIGAQLKRRRSIIGETENR
jgi:hypothetical protein